MYFRVQHFCVAPGSSVQFSSGLSLGGLFAGFLRFVFEDRLERLTDHRPYVMKRRPDHLTVL